MKIKIISVIMACFILIGCGTMFATKVEPLPENTAFVEKIPYIPPAMPAINIVPFRVEALNEEILRKKLEQNQNVSYIGLTIDNFQSVTLLINDLVNAIEIRDKVIKEMIEYYKPNEVKNKDE